MSVTLPGEGTLLQMMVSAAYTTIAGVTEFDGFEVTAAAIKTTRLADTLHKYRKSRVIDPGKLSGKLQIDPNDTVHQSIFAKITAVTAPVDDDFKIIFVDDDTTPASCTFLGFFTKYKLTGEKIDENLMVDFEIQLTTLPVFVPGTP